MQVKEGWGRRMILLGSRTVLLAVWWVGADQKEKKGASGGQK